MSFISSVEGLLGKVFKFVISGQATKDVAVVLSTVDDFEAAIGLNIGNQALGKAAAWNTALAAIGASAVKAALAGTAAVTSDGANIALDVVAWQQCVSLANDVRGLLGGKLPAAPAA